MNSKLLLWFIFIFLLIFYSIGFCQCIMGDCENGYGVANFENGDKYVGNWKNNKFHGKGKYLLKNGNYLDGEFNNGTFEGVGKQFNSSDSTAIIGNWKQGKLVDGKVEKYIGNLKIFEGKIVNGKNNGYGKYIFPNGAVYEGNWKDDEFDGNGKLTINKNESYDGEWKKGKRDGVGINIYSDGSKYKGDWISDRRDGYGISFSPDGSRYEGEWKNDTFDGKGIYFLKNGNKMDGIWKKGKFIEQSSDSTSIKSIKINSRIKMARSGSGEFKLPIIINDVMKIEVIINTGASELLVTPDFFLKLYKDNAIKDDDILEGRDNFKTGSITNNKIRFNIKEIKIGNQKYQNISGKITESNDVPIQIGQNLLKKIGKFIIDYEVEEFIILE